MTRAYLVLALLGAAYCVGQMDKKSAEFFANAFHASAAKIVQAR